MKKETLSLIGCGWLGKELAVDLADSNHNIIATTLSDKTTDFILAGVTYIKMDVTTDLVDERIINSDIVIYMIPPKELIYVKHFFDQIPVDKKIIFISSTSVYGKNLGQVDEETKNYEHFASSPLLIETETYIKTRFPRATIMRPGGLYGKKRHPINFLQGRTEVAGGHAFLHLTHLEDCLMAIKAIIKNSVWGETFNIVSDIKYKKNEYYPMMAQKLNLPSPHYLEYEKSMNETSISNAKSKLKLGMTYLDPGNF